MSITAGKVTAITGMVQAKDPITGEVRVLKQGDEIQLGDVIITSVNGNVTITLENGDLLTLGRDTQMALDEDVVGATGMTDPVTEATVDVAGLQQAVLEGNFEGLGETAAGPAAGDAGAGGSANAGATNTVDRIGAEGEVTSGYDTGTASLTVQQNEEVPPENNDPTIEGATGTVIEAGNTDDGTVVEGIPTVTGVVNASDVDNEETLTFSGSQTGQYGVFTIDAETGEWEYILDNDAANTLAEGEAETETFIVTVTDERGGSAQDSVVITIQGTNDSPEADDAAFESQSDTIEFSLADHVSDVEDDRDNVGEDRETGVKITSLPEFGTLYVGTEALNVGDVVADISTIRYEADNELAVLFDATRDLVDTSFESGAGSTYETEKGVILSGGTYEGGSPVPGQTTPADLYYGGGDNENGLGVGEDKEMNSSNREYVSFKFPSEVETSLITLGSVYGHYRDIAKHADAQIKIIALKDGEVVSEIQFNDAHNGETGRSGTGTFEALVDVEGGYDEIRAYTEAGYNSDMTLESVVLVNTPVEDSFTYQAVDVEDAYDSATVTLNAILQPTIDYVFLDQGDVIDGAYTVDSLNNLNIVQDFDPISNTLDLSELMDDSVTSDNVDQYLKLGYVDEDGDGEFDSTLMTVDSNGDQEGGDISYVYIQDVVDDEWNVIADNDAKGNFDLDD